jgi:predicted dehydrogenase
MNRYKVIVVGMGKRGMHHAAAFHANNRFEVAGLCDIDQGRLEAAAPKLGHPQISTDARALAAVGQAGHLLLLHAAELRSELIQAGIECGAKLIAFEKPVALTSAEGLKIKNHA